MGPTGSGKTALALSLYSSGGFSGIVNLDASQAYRQVTVGVAKPSSVELGSAPHYLFGIVDCVPRSLNAAQYRGFVESLSQAVLSVNGGLPIFVGGTLFYLKSLFLRLQEAAVSVPISVTPQCPGVADWDYLKLIDPLRAKNIHPHDSYRVARALEIYRSTGCLPSAVSPEYVPVFSDSLIVWINLPDKILKTRIYERADQMLRAGWIEEVESLIGTPWEEFVRGGFAIGYDDVYLWITAGKPRCGLDDLQKKVATKTWNYARRQRIFWRSLKKTLAAQDGVTIMECDAEVAQDVILKWRETGS